LRNGSARVAGEALEQLTARRGRAAVPLLLEALRAGGTELRGAALSSLAELGEPSTREALLAAAQRPDWNARAAVRGLVKIGGPELPATLTALVKGGKGGAGAALEALAERGGPEARAALLEGLASKDHQVNQVAADGLAKLRDGDVAAELKRMIADRTIPLEARQRIVSVWAEREDRAALLEAARGPDAAIARDALEALGKCGGAETERALDGALASGPLDQRQAALKGLRELGTSSATRSLQQALHQPALLGDATAALASVGGSEAMRAVGDRYGAATLEERLTIVGQLGDDSNPHSRPILAAALDSTETRLSLAAGRAIAGQLGRHERRRLLEALDGGGERAAAALRELRLALP
jgi:HEAT repeat protein